MLHRVVLGLCVLSLFSLGVVPARAGWTVVDLGAGDAACPGPNSGSPYWGMAINNLGNVAFTLGSDEGLNNGTSWPSSYFYGKSTKSTVALGGLYPGLIYADVFGINDNNIVVGDSYDYQNPNFPVAMAWKWNGSTGGTMADLTTISGGLGVDPSGNPSDAYAINKNNQVTGFAQNYAGNPGYQTAYVLNVTNAFAGSSPSATLTWLPVAGRGSSSAQTVGQSINDNGCVVMQSAMPSTIDAYYDGGSPTLSSSWANPMAAPPSGVGTRYASAINNAGYALCSAPPGADPLGWVVDTTARSNVTTYDRSIPPLVAGGTSFGCALNNNATPQVVGYGSTASGGTDALIWTYGAATAADLNTYAAGLGAANLAGWDFQYADGVNNNGEVVGYGTLDGVSSAFALLYYGGPGDANGDGRVDVNDLTIVLTNFGKTGATWSQGEFTGDGTVDVNDLTIVLSNYGTTHGAGITAVPEPGSLAMVAALLFAMVLGTARRRN